jgi:hypothetical protein
LHDEFFFNVKIFEQYYSIKLVFIKKRALYTIFLPAAGSGLLLSSGFHGPPIQKLEDEWSFPQNSQYCFWEYPDTHGLMHPTWDYHSSQEGEEGFCTNCELIEILKHGRKKFKCLGHEIADLEKTIQVCKIIKKCCLFMTKNHYEDKKFEEKIEDLVYLIMQYAYRKTTVFSQAKMSAWNGFYVIMIPRGSEIIRASFGNRCDDYLNIDVTEKIQKQVQNGRKKFVPNCEWGIPYSNWKYTFLYIDFHASCFQIPQVDDGIQQLEKIHETNI